MRIEIEISDELLALAASIAEAQGTSLPVLIEAGLRHMLAASADSGNAFRLQKHTFAGGGLNPDLAGTGWDEIRALAYEGRGG